jgi:hypothetical protein
LDLRPIGAVFTSAFAGEVAMRWFWAFVVIVVLMALDRAYMQGRNAEILLSAGQRGAATVNRWAHDLTNGMRR